MPLIGYKIIILLILTAWVAWAGYDYGYDRGADKVQAAFDKYKGEVNEQIQKAKIANAATEAAQDAKYDHAKAGYGSDVARLNIALKRLCESRAMSWNKGVCVANPDGGTLPEKAGDTTKPTDTVKAGTGILSADELYSYAMSDTLQCRTLIQFLK